MLYRYKKVGLASPILGGGGGPPSSVWTRAPTVREIVIGLASFFFACLLFRDPQNPTYEYYANLPKQIIYRWKGLPAGPVKTLLIFGDSFSDNCNLWRLRASQKDREKYPFPACPTAPMGRSNGGRTWPDIVSRDSPLQILNFAHSASTCNNDIIPVYYHDDVIDEERLLPAVQDQIQLFDAYKHRLQLGSHDEEAMDKAAFPADETVAVIYTGVNDLAGILAVVRQDAKQDALRTTAKVEDEAQCVMDRIQQLYDLGIRRIVIMNTIPLERAPLFFSDTIGDKTTQNGTAIAQQMVDLVLENNERQAELLPFVRRKLYDADIQLFNTHALFESLFAHPEATYGESYNIDSWCHYCLTGECHLCKDPATYMFMDDLHPTERTHEVIAEHLASFIGLPRPKASSPKANWG